EHRTVAKTSRSGRSPACWTESTEAYGPSRRRGSAEGAVQPKPEIGGRVHPAEMWMIGSCVLSVEEQKYQAWLVDLDGTLYRAAPVKLAMAFELALLGWGA